MLEKPLNTTDSTAGVISPDPEIATGSASGSDIAAATSIGGKRKLTIAIVLHPSLPGTIELIHDNPTYRSYHSPIIRGIQDTVVGTSTEIVAAYMTPDMCLDYFHHSPIDGMIIIAVHTDNIPDLRKLSAERIPFVGIGVSAALPEDIGLPVIDAANRGGGVRAAQHLIGLGHRQVACVNLAYTFSNHSDRMKGFLGAFNIAQRPVGQEYQLLRPGYIREEFEDVIAEWLAGLIANNRLPTAIFACDYDMAEATYEALRRHSITIPDQVSVVGFDDPPEAALFSPPLTTMQQPVYDMGVVAGRRLREALNAPGGKSLWGSVVLDTNLVVRGSTSRLRPVPPPPATKFRLPWQKRK